MGRTPRRGGWRGCGRLRGPGRGIRGAAGRRVAVGGTAVGSGVGGSGVAVGARVGASVGDGSGVRVAVGGTSVGVAVGGAGVKVGIFVLVGVGVGADCPAAQPPSVSATRMAAASSPIKIGPRDVFPDCVIHRCALS